MAEGNLDERAVVPAKHRITDLPACILDAGDRAARRLPDLCARMHAASKTGLVGAGLTFVGIAIVLAHGAIVLRAVLGLACLARTTPVSSHLLARAAVDAGYLPVNTSNSKQQYNLYLRLHCANVATL